MNIVTPNILISRNTPHAGLVIFSIAVLSFTQFDEILAVTSCLLGGVLLAIALIDARHMIIPDILSLPLIPAGLISAYFLTDNPEPHLVLLHHVIASAIAGGGFYLIRTFYREIRGREGLGLGDVKLILATGAWTGLLGVSYVILLACILAISYFSIAQLTAGEKLTRHSAIPFGTFLAPSMWLVWVFLQMSGGLNNWF